MLFLRIWNMFKLHRWMVNRWFKRMSTDFKWWISGWQWKMWFQWASTIIFRGLPRMFLKLHFLWSIFIMLTMWNWLLIELFHKSMLTHMWGSYYYLKWRLWWWKPHCRWWVSWMLILMLRWMWALFERIMSKM